MASLTAIKSRIRSVSSTKQITKAMELVAASKMRRAQETTMATSLYSEAASELLTKLSNMVDVQRHPLFVQRPVKSRLIIVITSDRGLAGAYDANVLKRYTQALKDDRAAGITTKTISIGRKGATFLARVKDVDVIGIYRDFPDIPEANTLRPILATVTALYERGEIDALDVIYTDYINSLTQKAATVRLLPAGFRTQTVSHELEIAEFEPSAEEVLERAALRLVELQLFQTLLDARASEYSMRMIAMRSATDNATNLVTDLTLELNNVRQAAITQELAEITGGAEAMQ